MGRPRNAHEAARTRLLIGEVFMHLGDQDSANIELEAARQAFKRLGAAPTLRARNRRHARPDPRLPAD